MQVTYMSADYPVQLQYSINREGRLVMQTCEYKQAHSNALLLAIDQWTTNGLRWDGQVFGGGHMELPFGV